MFIISSQHLIIVIHRYVGTWSPTHIVLEVAVWSPKPFLDKQNKALKSNYDFCNSSLAYLNFPVLTQSKIKEALFLTSHHQEILKNLKSMFEWQILWSMSQMPLAHQFTSVPNSCQDLWYQDLLLLDPTYNLLGSVCVPARVAGLVEPIPQGQSSCQQRCSGWRTDGGTGVELRKQNSFR